MKLKRICSFLIACVLLCGSVGVMESHVNTAHAMPSMMIGLSVWQVWGPDLHHEIPLARTRVCPQGIGNVIAIINRCIKERRSLIVRDIFGRWYYHMT